eukprot:CAMPEP_0197602964 /NCGR_PEP_ID=MMETSP1326-20131121/38261_1 /TAXON_ID=1155430 /ORGANISM="Genus nov. species nov., Strain RCC2288" /LENGTH=32 /DNA_ID= /DNA_START= /DNA_END= /DNA_ORIENTATION=
MAAAATATAHASSFACQPRAPARRVAAASSAA